MAFGRRFSRPGLMGLASALFAAVGAILPGLHGGAGPATGGGIDALDLLTLLFAMFALTLVVLHGSESREPVGVIGYGLVIAGLGLWQLLLLGGSSPPGVGLYLTLVGGAGLLGAGLWGYQVELTRPGDATAGYR